MSKIQWESGLAECPFCEQLKAMGWQWISGDKSVLVNDLLPVSVRMPLPTGGTT